MPSYLSRRLLDAALQSDLQISAQRNTPKPPESDPLPPPEAPAVDFGALTKSLTALFDEPGTQPAAPRLQAPSSPVQRATDALSALFREPTAPTMPSAGPGRSPAIPGAEQAPNGTPISARPSAVPAPTPAEPGSRRSYAEQMAQKYGLNWSIFDRQLNQESGYSDTAVSEAGARGPGQFMPETGNAVARQLGVTPAQFWADPNLQIEGAALHMRDLLAANNGDYRMALAAYNAGQGNVNRYGEGVFAPDFARGQTRDYVNIILGPGAAAGRPAPNAPSVPPPAAGAASSSPPAATAPSRPATAGGSAPADTVTIQNIDDGRQIVVKRADVDGFLRSPAPGVPPTWRVVGDARVSRTADIASGPESFSANALSLKEMPADQAPDDGGYVDPDQDPRESGYTLPADPADPRTYDEGPREAIPGSVGAGPARPNYEIVSAESPSPVTNPMQTGEAWMPAPAQAVDVVGADGQAGNRGPSYEVPIAPKPTEPPQIVRQSMPSLSLPDLTPVWDAAGRVIGYVRDNLPSPEQIDQGARQAASWVEENAQRAMHLQSPVSPLDVARFVGENTEPAGGAPRQIQRMDEIARQAARDTGADANPNEVLTRRAVYDPQWRLQNPELAQEYDDLQRDFGLNVMGQVGDAAPFARNSTEQVARIARGAGERAAQVPGVAQGAARGGIEAITETAPAIQRAGRALADVERAVPGNGEMMLGSGFVPERTIGRGGALVDVDAVIRRVAEEWRMPVEDLASQSDQLTPGMIAIHAGGDRDLAAQAIEKLRAMPRLAPTPKTANVPEPWQMTREELRAYEIPSPMGDRSRNPADLADVRETFPTLDTLVDDDYGFNEALGRGGDRSHDVSRTVGAQIRRGNPITVYRATDAEGTIFPGAYVTPSRRYAIDHGERNMGRGAYRIVEIKAYPDELATVNPNEFFYVPRDLDGYHRQVIEQAVREGKPVPPSVLAEYPDLAPRGEPPGAVPEGGMQLGSGVVPESRRMYHGTAGEFARPDPGKFDPNGLFGPGYYLTSDPRVAGSYSTARAEQGRYTIAEAQRIARQAADTLESTGEPSAREWAQGIRDFLDQTTYASNTISANEVRDSIKWNRPWDAPSSLDPVLDRVLDGIEGPVGPNIRAVDVPSGLRMLDADAPLSNQEIDQIRASLTDQLDRNVFESVRAQHSDPNSIVAVRAALNDVATGWHGRTGNSFLAAAGYDGIAHTGGRRVPMLDDAGRPIEHDVSIIFPESLDKIRNAFSGEQGGAGFIPTASVLRNAAQGAVLGAGSETLQAQQEGRDADPGEQARRALIGGGLAVVAGSRAGRQAAEQLGSGFVNSRRYRPPTPQQVQAAEAAGARRGQMLNRAVQAPPSEVPPGVRIATRATDDRAGLRWAEDVLSDAAGTPRMRENDPLRPSTQSRVNAGSIADERIKSGLEPAVVDAGRAGLQDELPQYVEDMHQKDILDEFYNRGYQEAMDAAAPGLAAMQARGASAARIQAAQARIQDAAERAGLRKMRAREGNSIDMTYERIEARLQAQEQRTQANGTWDQLQQSAQRIWDHNAETRRRLVDAGEMDPADAAYFEQTYPHYVPTVPISHLDARGSGPVASSAGPRVSRGNQKVVQALEDVGTAGERLNPIVASRMATVRAERAIQKNTVARAFAQMMDDALAASPGTMGTSAATHRTFLGGGTDITFMDGGKPVTMSVPDIVAQGLNAASEMQTDPGTLGRLWKAAMSTVTAAMTAARASFLPVNLVRDLGDYATRTATLEGGPHQLPAVLGTWMQNAGRAVSDIALAQANPRGAIGAGAGFVAGAAQGDQDTTLSDRLRHGVEGAVAGTFLLGANKVKATGAAREFLARGGGSGGLASGWRPSQRWYREVMRDGGAPIASVGDAARYLGDWMQDILTLQGVKGINERAELISRTAAMQRADARGMNATEAMIRGRDASVDFDRAGTVARMVNGVVPFFNATVQGGAQTARLFRDNPAAAATTITATVAPVMLAAEAWNRSDPERARVYDDVPQYVKDTGLVVVTPWAGSDARGDRPTYLWIPSGMQTPFVIGMRAALQSAPFPEEAAGRVGPGADASLVEKWADVLNTVVQTFSPLRGDSASSLASNLVPQGAKQALELGINKDLYRGNPIVTDAADERASAASKAVAGGINAAGRQIGNDWLQNVHPSGVEHLMRSLPAYNDLVSGASDMVAPSGYKQAEDRPVANEPFVGGIGARFVRDTGGANLQRAQDARIPDSVRPVLEEAGMRPEDIGMVPASYKNAPLTRSEQERWQNMTNTLMAREIQMARRDPKWRDPSTREEAVKAAAAKAREDAAQRVLRNLNDREIDRRKRVDQSRKAS